MMLLLLALATETATASEPPSAVAPPHNYLHAADPCDGRAVAADEVVVCGAKDVDERYRLRAQDNQRYQDPPLRAAMKLGGGTAVLGTSRAGVGGFPSNRIMVTLNFPF
jgi:hypothetical protein